MFNLPTYRITPSAHPVKCPLQCPSLGHSHPPQCPSLGHPHLLPTSPSTTRCSFPRVRCLSCFVTLSDFSHSSSLLSPIILFTISYIPYMSETIWWLSFPSWLTSLSIIPSSSIHIKAKGGYTSFLMAESDPIVYIDHIYPSSVEGHCGSFHSLAIVDIAAINIGVQVSQHFTISASLG